MSSSPDHAESQPKYHDSTAHPGAVHLTKDDACLEDLGYRPELKRNFSKLETFGVAFSIMYVVLK
jgi:hypothetical protein